jgi:hypothetical protein
VTEPMVPVDIQKTLDDWLAGNPAAQKYVSKLWYVPDGQPVPADVTHTIRLASQLSPERALTIGLVVLPEFALVLDALLAMIATQPPATRT